MPTITALEAMKAVNEFADWVAEKFDPEIVSVRADAYDSTLSHETPAVDITIRNPSGDVVDAFLNATHFDHGRLRFRAVASSPEMHGHDQSVTVTISFRSTIVE